MQRSQGEGKKARLNETMRFCIMKSYCICQDGVSWIRWSQRIRTRDTVIYMKTKRKVEWELGEWLVLGGSF